MRAVPIMVCVALLLMAMACSSPRSRDNNHVPQTSPDAAPAITACTTDIDCTRGWLPTHNSCGPVERCFGDECVQPPAMTGDANTQTGRIVFETQGGDRSFHIEVVDDRFEISRGLMCRNSMEADWGMLFLMEQTRRQSFWMKNTHIALDMVFLDEEWRVVGVTTAQPLTLVSRSVEGVSRYVLELKAGVAETTGITAGAQARYFAPQNPR